MFYVMMTFYSGVMMAGALWFWLMDQAWPIVRDFFAQWPDGDLTRLVVISIFPVLHLLVSIPQPVSFLSSLFYW
jgi:multisubunit Na+/H+ antiporter MnhB subunit